MTRKPEKAALWAAASMLCAAALGCNDVEAQPDPARPAKAATTASARSQTVARVEVAIIQPSEAKLALSLPGEVEAWRDAKLAAPLGGFVEKVHVESGDEVKKGQPLALIDTATHLARRNQMKVELDTAKRELKRAEKLGDALPGAQLDAAQSRVDAARAAYRTAEVQVARSVISAPFAGTVAMVDIEEGEVAAPGVPLIRVVKLDPVKVTASLSDRDVLAIHVGQSATVSTDARGVLLTGKVSHVHPAADLKTRSFIAEIEVDNKEHQLLPGMIAQVRVASDVAEAQMVIPQDWLVTKPTEIGVFLSADGHARWRPVKVGSVVRDQVVILEGLAPGDELVITGHRELADGDELLVARKGVCCTDGRVVFEHAKGNAQNEPAQ